MMGRREFIQACTVMLGSSVLAMGCGQGGGDPAVTGDPSLPDLSQARWANIPVTTFSVSHESYGVIDMELVEIDDEIYVPETEQFSIILRGPELPLFEEDRYQVYNDSLGYIELYLQPGESDPGEQKYRAVFSILQA